MYNQTSRLCTGRLGQLWDSSSHSQLRFFLADILGALCLSVLRGNHAYAATVVHGWGTCQQVYDERCGEPSAWRTRGACGVRLQGQLGFAAHHLDKQECLLNVSLEAHLQAEVVGKGLARVICYVKVEGCTELCGVTWSLVGLHSCH